MTEQAEAHLDSRRLERHGDKLYGDYILRLDDTEAVERSPFSQRLMALGWLGLTEIIIYHPPKNDGTSADDLTKWIVHGFKKIQGSEPMVARHLGGELTLAATISADGERELDFAFGAGPEVECDPNDLNELVWEHLEAMHRSLSGGEVGNLPIADNQSSS